MPTLRWISKVPLSLGDTAGVMGKHRRLAIVFLLSATALSGCSTMLPHGRAEDVSHFKTY